MYFETAGIEVALWVPPLVAFLISFFTCMGGVSGAFLLLPFQMSVLGFTSPAVSATNQLFNATSIPAGVYRYWREGRMVWPLTAVIVFGTLPGVLLGAVVRVRWLPEPHAFKAFAGLVLAYLGWRLLRDLMGGSAVGAARPPVVERFHRGGGDGSSTPGGGVDEVRLGWSRLSYTFLGARYEVPVPGLVALTFLVGLVGGVYGIGGGSIVAPFLVSVYGLPVYTIAGPVLLGTFLTSAVGVVIYQALAPLYPTVAVAPDWLLGVLFGVGGMAGMYLGARVQRRVPERWIKGLLAGIVLLTAAKYGLDVLGG